MNPDVGLSALIVNYASGAFALRCVESLQRDWADAGRDPARLEVVVVDNASPIDQTAFLDGLENLGCKVIRGETNLGYAGGINLAYAASSGQPEDVVAILNPDLHFLPGSVSALVDYVSTHSDCGAVDPRACIDPLGVLNLPRNPLPTLGDQLGVTLAHMSPAWCRLYSERRLKKGLPWWTADGPVDSDMLSGCCLFLRRAVVEELRDGQAGPMDERYPLYYEDTDLFARLRKRGYRLVHHGGARILHHWARSTGVGGDAADDGPLRKQEESRRAYYRKFYGSLGERWVDTLAFLQSGWPAEKLHRPMHALSELGVIEEPVVIPLPRACRYLIELAVSPNWLLAVGILGEGERFVCPPETWEWYFQAHYFMRALDRDTGDFLGAWHFAKPSPGRNTPLEFAEVDALGTRLFGFREGLAPQTLQPAGV